LKHIGVFLKQSKTTRKKTDDRPFNADMVRLFYLFHGKRKRLVKREDRKINEKIDEAKD